jgi:hypothetical protein
MHIREKRFCAPRASKSFALMSVAALLAWGLACISVVQIFPCSVISGCESVMEVQTRLMGLGLAGRIGRNYRLRNVLSRNYWLCNEEVLVVLGLESGLSWVSEIGLRDG